MKCLFLQRTKIKYYAFVSKQKESVLKLFFFILWHLYRLLRILSLFCRCSCVLVHSHSFFLLVPMRTVLVLFQVLAECPPGCLGQKWGFRLQPVFLKKYQTGLTIADAPICGHRD